MRNCIRNAILVFYLYGALGSIPALAQSWDYTPGGQTGQQNMGQQVITPLAGGGYAVAPPGQPPVLIQPFGNGYTVAQPGQQPTLVQPFGQNQWIVTPPLNGAIPPIQPIAPIPPIGGY